jgi:hypothetical protein
MKKNNLLMGLAFIALAVCLILNQVTDMVSFKFVAKILVAVIFAKEFIKGIAKKRIFTTIMSLTFVFLLFKNEILKALDYQGKNISGWVVFWAALFVSIGLSLIFGKKQRVITVFGDGRKIVDDELDDIIIDADEYKDDTQNSVMGEKVYFKATFSSVTKYVKSDNFKRADLECRFGDLDVYFDKAKVSEDGAIINVDVNFGDATIYIPKEWDVDNRITTGFGSVHEQGRGTTGGPKAVIKGSSNFADVTIKYV